MNRAAVLDLDPAAYVPHALHAPERAWVEKNCYIDIWIEVLHALRLDPMAVLPFVLAIDFEGDQWTFFKPPHAELWSLYGVDVQELNVWRPILDHAVAHCGQGKLVSTEADAFFLPDTAGTDYRSQHTKTTIVIDTVDAAARRLKYFHNAGYHALEGEDFAGLFRLEAPPDPAFMPLFAELIRVDRVRRRPAAELKALSLEGLARHLARSPAENPVTRFGERLSRELSGLAEEGLARYHAYAFATIRQLGAAFELAALYVDWLERHGESGLRPAAEAFERISSAAKALILKAARAVNSRRPADFGEMTAGMASAWDEGVGLLAGRYGARTPAEVSL
jgi:hypothetical protein